MPHGPVNVPTLKVSLELQLLCVQARVEEVGQALLRKTQDAGGVGPRRKGKHSRFHMDAYKKHMLLPDASPLLGCLLIIIQLCLLHGAVRHRSLSLFLTPDCTAILRQALYLLGTLMLLCCALCVCRISALCECMLQP